MFTLGRFLTGEQNGCVKVGNNICLNWKPAPGIQVKVKIVDIEYFPFQFPPTLVKTKLMQGTPLPPKPKKFCKLKKSYPHYLSNGLIPPM